MKAIYNDDAKGWYAVVVGRIMSRKASIVELRAS